MFQKKTMNTKTYENGSNPYGNRFGGSGGFQDSLNMKETDLEKWKPAEGENLVDFVPFNATEANPLVLAGKAEVGDPMYSLDYFVHRSIGPNKANITCLKQYGEDCPLCRESQRIHDLNTDKYGYWDTGYKSVEEPLMNRARITKNPETGAAANVFDWEEGMSVKFLGTKKKFNDTFYNEPSTFDFVPRKPLSDEVLKHSIDLATVIKKTSAEDMEKLISGKAYSVSSDKPAETKPTQSVEAANVEDYDEEPSQTSSLAEEALNTAGGQSFDDMKPVEERKAAPTEHVCPFGHKFGENDKYPDCSKCDTEIWEKCLDSK